jgi:hypothetical protein
MIDYGMNQWKSLCRFCGLDTIEEILDLGSLSVSGVFQPNGEIVDKFEVVLGFCESCELTQLKHSYKLSKVFTDSYGYESGLNTSMSEHLIKKAALLQKTYKITSGIAVDIASNDGTLLNGYFGLSTVGIDPLIPFVTNRYPPDTIQIPEYFSSSMYFKNFTEKAEIVTSNSVLYDLDNPLAFAREISSILKEDGIWHFEQSYLPTMIKNLSFDTICHEHLLYLTLSNIEHILEYSGMQIMDAELNNINGGSIAVTAIKTNRAIAVKKSVLDLRQLENTLHISFKLMLADFANSVESHIAKVKSILVNYKQNGFKIYGLGASTKGNILIQALKLPRGFIEGIGDINPKKFELRTPGSNIPIIPEEIVYNSNVKTLALVLPWHFKQSILKKSQSYIANGNLLLFPLPAIEIIDE